MPVRLSSLQRGAPTAARQRPTFRHLAVIGLVLAALAVLGGVSPAGAGAADTVNAQRAAAGLPALAESSALDATARQHAAEMAASRTLYHTPSLAGTLGPAAPGWTALAENVGYGPTLASTMSAFLSSPMHRANIMGNYNIVGVGVVTGPDGVVWVTEQFAQTGTSTVAAPPRPAPRVSRAAPASRPDIAPPPPPPPPPAPPAPVQPIVGFSTALATRGGPGYFMVGSDGGVFAMGDAIF